ncbi:MAG: lipase family protein [Candidatus Nanopelagicales bacterium]
MRALKWVGIVVASVLVIAMISTVGVISAHKLSISRAQAKIAAFYVPPTPLPSEPGTVIRQEPLGVDVPGATAQRILYTSQRPDGSPAASSGMIFIPTSPAPPGGRPVVAWAHGTLGLGDACAPSRSTNPLGDTKNWLDQMMQLGYVVVATDYTGFGTPGPNLYLVGQAEARDVVNSVRAARNIPSAHAGNDWIVWGHSQGGHSALWTGELAKELAPELTLKAVAAAAPAAELPDIIDAQWQTAVGWAIGPEVVESWPHYYPDLTAEGFVSASGLRNTARLANECIVSAALEGFLRTDFGQDYFEQKPTNNPSWAAAAKEQTPAPLPASMPVFVAQSIADTVVLAWPNAKLQEQWCAAGSDITMAWLGVVSHQDTAMTVGPEAVAWIDDRFNDRPTTRTCDVPPPVAPEAS